MTPQQLITANEEETVKAGRRLGRSLTIPSLVLLEGSLGAGKTALTRGIVEGCGCDDPTTVHSPTFSLINEYECAVGPVYHVDLYRLDTVREHYSIGLDELLSSEAIIIIEWAEKLLFAVEATWKITIEVIGENRRRITLRVG